MGLALLLHLQSIILEIYLIHPSETHLQYLKTIIANYFAAQLISSVNQSIAINKITEQDLEKWLNESRN